MADDLQAHLDALPDKLHEQLSTTLGEQAELLSAAQQAALQALEQPPAETGHLEASCVVLPGSNDLAFIVHAGGELTTDASGYDHSESFEFGTSREPARPFFYPTYNAMKDGIQQAITDALNEVLK